MIKFNLNKTNKYLISILIITIAIFLTILNKNKIFKVTGLPGGDEAVYFNTAYNIKNFNVASYQKDYDRIFVHKNVLKPPLYSYYLSLFYPKNNDDLNCLYSKKKQECVKYLNISKNVNFYTHISLSLILFLFVYLLTKNAFISLFSFILILTSTYFLNITNYFLSEGFSALIFLIHSFSFCFLRFANFNENNLYLLVLFNINILDFIYSLYKIQKHKL